MEEFIHRHLHFMKKILILALFLGLFTVGMYQTSLAQSHEQDWSTPVNLSRSGGSLNPAVVADSQGTLHVVWEDTFSGSVYSRLEESTWTLPTRVNFPFESNFPHLIADPLGRIHAFWLDEEDEDLPLFYSRVLNAGFGQGFNWVQSLRLSPSATALQVAIDLNDNLHLVFIQTREFENLPAGIYYRRSTNGGANWTLPTPLFQSMYFRGLTAETSRLQLAISQARSEDPVRLLVAWDYRPLQRIQQIQSSDGGSTWAEVVETAGPQGQGNFSTPFNIAMSARGSEVIQVWNVGQPGESCSPLFRVSADGGQSWNEAQRMPLNLSGCPQDYQFVRHIAQFAVLMIEVQDQIQMVAWDGLSWGQPFSQPTLFSFEDPQTLNTVQLRCRQTTTLQGNLFVTVGCDAGKLDLGGGDIWATFRPVGTLDQWFPASPVWTSPEIIHLSETELNALSLVSDRDGRFHAFWQQLDTSIPSSPQVKIFYARFEDGIWSTPRAVLESPVGPAFQPQAALDARDRLNLVWTAGGIGDLYYSWANAELAVSTAEWEPPAILPAPQPLSSAPDIYIAAGGEIYVVYAVPINESRGIYLTKSTDGGRTWQETIQIFDAAEAGWESVERPRLTRSSDGRLYALWTQHSFGGNQTQNLFFAQSEGDEATWSNPQFLAEGTIPWSDIVTVGDQVLHRFWMTLETGNPTVFHQYSLDQGLTWSRETEIASQVTFARQFLPQILATDIPHFLLATRDNEGRLYLEDWTWNGTNWIPDASLNLSFAVPEGDQPRKLLAGAISDSGQLGVLLNGLADDPFVGMADYRLFFTSRTLDPTAFPQNPTQPILNTPESPADPTPTSGPEPTATLAFPINPDAGSGSGGGILGLNTPWTGTVVGVVLAGILVTVVITISVTLFGPKRKAN